jgi:hypothetical protein
MASVDNLSAQAFEWCGVRAKGCGIECRQMIGMIGASRDRNQDEEENSKENCICGISIHLFIFFV